MVPTERTRSVSSVIIEGEEAMGQIQHDEEDQFKLSRWLVSFRSGTSWYPVGEYVALDTAGAIDRAIEIFGSACGYRAEEIPWDAAPLPRTNAPCPRRAQ